MADDPGDKDKPDDESPEAVSSEQAGADAVPAESAADDSDAATAEPPDAGEVALAQAEELTLEEAQAWAGAKLDDLSGSTVGKVEAVYVDEESGRPEWLQARMGRFGHHCLVPARDAVGAAGRVWVPFTRDQIRKAPRHESGMSVERDAEAALLDHYGIGSGGVGRAGEIAGRDPSAITARPA